ncbi:MAG: tetratricopeptide repeat protein [Cytophagaceae bacterium]|nr:tetratricopeptide repeat protein [Cytophagaceae bacterium]
MGDEEGLAICYTNLGICYGMLNEHQKALRYLDTAYTRRKNQHSVNGLIASALYTGQVYSDMKKPDLAIPKLTEALRLSEQLNDDGRVFDATYSLGKAYFDQGIYALAIQKYKTANVLYLKIMHVEKVFRPPNWPNAFVKPPLRF